MEKYYEAYDKRYTQVHDQNLSWSSNNNTPILEEIIKKYHLEKSNMLEIGCGEGRDTRYLLNKGYQVFAVDISKEAIAYCKKEDEQHSKQYEVVDVLQSEYPNHKYDFIYSVATLHMLVRDQDRDKYFQYIYNHLREDGYSLILSLGDGTKEYQSDINESWKDTIRVHEETKKELLVATTSCRVVSFEQLEKEIKRNQFQIIEKDLTSIEPDFRKIMYIVIKKVN